MLRTVKTKKTELLFIALILRMLKVGGRSATIVPDGVLFGASKAHVQLRKHLIETTSLEAVISCLRRVQALCRGLHGHHHLQPRAARRRT
jgi:type I restriction-modification system DNA methylase subunit